MRDNIVLITFILLLPVLAVLGHDLYIAYGDSEEKIEKLQELDVNPSEFSFSGVGRLWITYASDSFNTVRNSISPATWKNVMAPFIELPAVVAAAIPLVIFYLITAILWVLGLGPYRRTPKVAGVSTRINDRDTGKKQKFKRK